MQKKEFHLHGKLPEKDEPDHEYYGRIAWKHFGFSFGSHIITFFGKKKLSQHTISVLNSLCDDA